MKRFLPILPLLLFCVMTALAAFIATEDFESYSVAAELNGGSGGTNWTGNWTGTSGQWTVQTAPSGMTGKAARNEAVSTPIRRSFTAITAGPISFKMRTNTATPGEFCGCVLEESGTPRMYVRFGPTGNIEIYNETAMAYQTIAAYSANTVYTITIDFDDAAQPDLYRAKVDAGSYTAYKGTAGAYTNIGTVRLECDPSPSWFDDIVPPAAGSAIVPILTSQWRQRR